MLYSIILITKIIAFSSYIKCAVASPYTFGNPARVATQVLCLVRGQPGYCHAQFIGYSQLTIISNDRSPGSRWIGVIVTTYHIYSSLIASDIDEEMWAEYPEETELSTHPEQARPDTLR